MKRMRTLTTLIEVTLLWAVCIALWIGSFSLIISGNPLFILTTIAASWMTLFAVLR